MHNTNIYIYITCAFVVIDNKLNKNVAVYLMKEDNLRKVEWPVVLYILQFLKTIGICWPQYNGTRSF